METPDRPAPRRPLAASVLLIRQLRAVDAELGQAIPRVLNASDDEAIHDLRVAIRRLRTLLKLARPVFGRFHADAVRAAFTAVHRATGSLRDEEVLDETLDAIAHDAPAFLAWKGRRRARERLLRRAVVARLRAGELTRARHLLHALVTLPVHPSRDGAAMKLARRAIERARREVEGRRDAPVEDSVALHDLRIAYKELRYGAELLRDALPADLAAMSEPASRFQKRLGEIHDADMALLTIQRARGLDPAGRLVVVAALGSLRIKRVGKYIAEMAPAATPSASADVQTPANTARVPVANVESAPGRVAARGRGARPQIPHAARVTVTKSASSHSGRSRAS